MTTVSHDFLQSLLSLEPLHHGASVLTSTIAKKRNKRNNQTRIAVKLGLSLCTVTNAHHHCFELVCPLRNYLFFFLFSVKTKHAAYLVYAVRVTLEGEETDEQKMPALLTTRIQAGMTESASTLHRSFPPLLFFLLQPSL